MKPPKRKAASERPPAKRPAHRPPYVPSTIERNNVESMTACGIPQRDICASMNISLATLHRYFRVEINTGATKAVAMVAAALYNKAIGGDVHAQKYFLNNRAPRQWQERVVVVDGGTEADPASLTDEQIAERLTRLKRSGAVVRASKAQGTVH